MKSRYRLLFISLSVLLTASIFLNVTQALSAGTAQPGSAEDPIISKSYVDAETAKLKNELLQLQNKYDDSVKALQAAMEELKTSALSKDAEGFVVVELPKGTKLLTGAGTEVILRSGTATALKGANGNLADTTSAKDLNEGEKLSKNHLLISSRDDGRGLLATSLCYLLVRGGYKTSTAKKGVITASALKIRSQANTSSDRLGTVYKNETVEILDEENGWYRIKTKDSVIGWVLGQYLKITDT